MRVFKGNGGINRTVAISPDSRYLASGSIWELSNPTAPLVDSWATGYVHKFEFISPTQIFAEGVSPWKWWRYDIATGETVELDPRAGQIARSAAVHPSRELLRGTVTTYGGGDGVDPDLPCDCCFVYRFTPSGLEATGQSTLPAELIAYHPQGIGYLVRDSTNTYSMFDAETEEELAIFAGPKDHHFNSFPPVFSPDGSRLYLQHRWGIEAFDGAKGGLPLATLGKQKLCKSRTMAMHPGGRMLASTDGSSTITFHDPQTLHTVRTYDFKMGVAHCVAFTPDGIGCIVGYARGKILLFDLDD